jgi:hypothetical protein
LVHTPEQDVKPGGQPWVQTPPLQDCPLAQARPQAPQLRESLPVLTQAPLQSCWPAGQAQTPAVQDCPLAQARPQAPQLVASTWGLTQAPLQSR